MARGEDNAGWTAEETSALVSVWGHAEVQTKLDGVTRNRTVFERISKELREMGFAMTVITFAFSAF